MRGGRPHAPIRPIGYRPPRRGGWSSFSPRRKFRLIRTGVIALTLVVLISVTLSRCGSDDPATKSGSTTTTAKPKATTTSAVPLNLTATVLNNKLPSSHYQAQATTVGGKVLVLGGLSKSKSSTNVIWSFDPATGSTTQTGSLTSTLNSAAATAFGNTVFVVGGATPKGSVDTIQSYGVGDKAAAAVGKLPGPRTDAVAVTDPKTSAVYLVGGWDGTNPTNDVLMSTDGVTFTPIVALAEPVRFASAAILDGVLWVFGGEWNDIASGSIQRIDLAKRESKVVAQMPETVSRAMGFVIDDSIFLAGGRVAAGRSNQIRRFDTETFTFTQAGALTSNLSDAAVAVVGRTAYVLGGLAPLATNQIQQLSPTP